ncbi:MAG TPA: winged helix-turn-helix transcriptional regulator [Candidatus Lokiarchaeia archaeon]
MGQEEVFKVLKEKGSMTDKEVAGILKISLSSASACLRRLVKNRDVEMKEEIKKYLGGKKGNAKINCKYNLYKIKGRKDIFKND